MLLLLQPLVLERVPGEREARAGGPVSWLHTKVRPMTCTESTFRLHVVRDQEVAGACCGWGRGSTHSGHAAPTHTHGDALSTGKARLTVGACWGGRHFTS